MRCGASCLPKERSLFSVHPATLLSAPHTAEDGAAFLNELGDIADGLGIDHRERWW